MARSLGGTFSLFVKRETNQNAAAAPTIRNVVRAKGEMSPLFKTVLEIGELSPQIILAVSIAICPLYLLADISVFF